MESSDRELITKFIETNVKLKRLYAEHSELERQLAEFEARSFLTTQEEQEIKKLKRRKLRGVDKMMQIVTEHQSI